MAGGAFRETTMLVLSVSAKHELAQFSTESKIVAMRMGKAFQHANRIR
jgi:hypothetical protein